MHFICSDTRQCRYFNFDAHAPRFEIQLPVALNVFCLGVVFFPLFAVMCVHLRHFLCPIQCFANQYANTNYRERSACDDWICLFFAPSIKLISLAQNFHSIYSYIALQCCRALYTFFIFCFWRDGLIAFCSAFCWYCLYTSICMYYTGCIFILNFTSNATNFDRFMNKRACVYAYTNFYSGVYQLNFQN